LPYGFKYLNDNFHSQALFDEKRIAVIIRMRGVFIHQGGFADCKPPFELIFWAFCASSIRTGG
jgi:hypothetical protein